MYNLLRMQLLLLNIVFKRYLFQRQSWGAGKRESCIHWFTLRHFSRELHCKQSSPDYMVLIVDASALTAVWPTVLQCTPYSTLWKLFSLNILIWTNNLPFLKKKSNEYYINLDQTFFTPQHLRNKQITFPAASRCCSGAAVRLQPSGTRTLRYSHATDNPNFEEQDRHVAVLACGEGIWDLWVPSHASASRCLWAH